jgi:hypothetical protein
MFVDGIIPTDYKRFFPPKDSRGSVPEATLHGGYTPETRVGMRCARPANIVARVDKGAGSRR